MVRRGRGGHRAVEHRHRIRLLGAHLGQRPGRLRHQGRRRPADLEPGRAGRRAHAVAGRVRLAERLGGRRPGAAGRPGQPGRAAAEQDRRTGRRGRPDQPAGPGLRRPAGAAVEQAQPGRPEPDDRQRRHQGHPGGHRVPGPAGHRAQPVRHRRRLPRLRRVLRHRRRLRHLRPGRQRAVADGRQLAERHPHGVANRQRQHREGGPRDHLHRRGLLRRHHRARRHQRDRPVRHRRGPDLAVVGRQRGPGRQLQVHRRG